MNKLYIIKVGTTFPATAKQFGDFDTWTAATLGVVDVETCILDVEHGAALPAALECAGVVITGSHSMVTDDIPWSVKLEEWIPSLLEAGIPFFGICYGHQLLAQAAGGQVGFHPCGKEIGTVLVHLLPDCANDVLFRLLPQSFFVHVTHSQTVLRLPPSAMRLAANNCEPNHAFRLGDCAWGVQFHPEYDADIMRSYIVEQADELKSAGLDVPELLHAVAETPVAAKTLRNFARIVEDQRKSECNRRTGGKTARPGLGGGRRVTGVPTTRCVKRNEKQMNIEVIKADYLSRQHEKDIPMLLDVYASDPMGGGQPLNEIVKNNLVKKLSKLPHAFSVIAYVDGQPAGLVNCFEAFSTFSCKPLINIHDVVVLNEYRGNGISQKMLNKVEEIAKSKGCCKVTLEVLSNNEVAKSAYSKFGFSSYELDPKAGVALFWQKQLINTYRDREESNDSPLPHHAAYGSVLRGSADSRQGQVQGNKRRSDEK